MRVLLVQDDSPTSRSIQMVLKAESMVVDTTDLGEDALEIAKLYDYDIILLDLALPDMDGGEVLRRLRQARVTTPVLILSGMSQPESKVQCLASGADDYLTKPFDRRELVARIQAIVRRSKGHAQSEIRTGKLAVNLERFPLSWNRRVVVWDSHISVVMRDWSQDDAGRWGCRERMRRICAAG